MRGTFHWIYNQEQYSKYVRQSIDSWVSEINVSTVYELAWGEHQLPNEIQMLQCKVTKKAVT